MRVTASAPGKVILSGEHAVVYGFPALVAAVNKRCQLTFEGENNSAFNSEFISKYSSLKQLFKAWKNLPTTKEFSLDSQIPVGRGLGSSAACSVAVSAIIQQLSKQSINLEFINNMAYKLEVLQHGKPSGVDNTIATYGGFLWFRRESPELSIRQTIVTAKKIDSLYLVDSGKPAESTKDLVMGVAERRQANSQPSEQIFRQIEETTRGFLRWMQGQESNLVELIRINHRSLVDLGVVGEKAQQIVQTIEKAGGAAKITGAGGVAKGSGFLLAYHPDSEKLRAIVDNIDLKLDQLQLGGEGVKLHE